MNVQSVKKKQLAIAGGILLLVAIVIVVALNGLGQKKQPAPSNLPTIQTYGQETSANNPAYAQNITEYNLRRAEEAKRKGTSALPVLTTVEEAPKPKEVQEARMPPAQRVEDPRNAETDRQRSSAIQSQIAQLMAQWKTPEAKTTFIDQKRDASRNSGTEGSGNAPGQSSAAVRANAATRVVDAGAELYATTDGIINTGDGMPGSATVRGGPYDGSVWTGKVARKGEVVSLTFERMTWNGKTYKAVAYAVDMETQRAVLTGDVDRKIMERFGWPFLAAMAGGYGRLMASSNNTTTIGVAGVTTTYQKPGVSDVVAGAVGAGADNLAQGLRQNTNAEITVQIPKDTPVMIRVIDTVTDDGKPAPALNPQVTQQLQQQTLPQVLPEQTGLPQMYPVGAPIRAPGPTN